MCIPARLYYAPILLSRSSCILSYEQKIPLSEPKTLPLVSVNRGRCILSWYLVTLVTESSVLHAWVAYHLGCEQHVPERLIRRVGRDASRAVYGIYVLTPLLFTLLKDHLNAETAVAKGIMQPLFCEGKSADIQMQIKYES